MTDTRPRWDYDGPAVFYLNAPPGEAPGFIISDPEAEGGWREATPEEVEAAFETKPETKPEAAEEVLTVEFTPEDQMILHLEDGSRREATPEERATYAAFEALARRSRGDSVKDWSKPLPRHRAPKFKDPGETVAPRLPANVFGAPRAIR